jgi:hypothetical protein
MRCSHRKMWVAGLVLSGPLLLLSCSAPAGREADSSTSVSPTVSASADVPSPSVTTSSAASPGPGRTSPGSTSTTAGGGVRATGVSITRTGGIAGVMQTLVISADGTWTYTDRKSGNTQSGKFTTSQGQDLARLAADPAIVAESRDGGAPPGCADGYIYTIAVGEASTRYEQCGAATKRPVTDQLLALVHEATPL